MHHSRQFYTQYEDANEYSSAQLGDMVTAKVFQDAQQRVLVCER